MSIQLVIIASPVIVKYLILFFGVFINLFSVVKVIINYFFKDHLNRYLLIRKLHPTYKKILEEHFRYYNDLSKEDKILFEKRVQKFINMKSFVPRGRIKEVSAEMKTLIAAAAIQLTFGYPGIYFKHFWKIIIYETDYYSNITNHYHQGEVNTKGFIILSWNNFSKGYTEHNSGRNLGLHEMAHALKIENAIRNQEFDFINYEDLKVFYKLAAAEITVIRESGSSFFRPYAGTNIHEFFAVSVENFFERPAKFYTYNPPLFNIVAKLLRQNPLEKSIKNLITS